MKINGLDKLQKTLADAQRAIEEVEGQLGSVSFDPNDPESIEVAIQDMEKMIDERLGPYTSNSIIGPMIEQMKETYRDGIIEKAAESRLRGDVSDE